MKRVSKDHSIAPTFSDSKRGSEANRILVSKLQATDERIMAIDGVKSYPNPQPGQSKGTCFLVGSPFFGFMTGPIEHDDATVDTATATAIVCKSVLEIFMTA